MPRKAGTGKLLLRDSLLLSHYPLPNNQTKIRPSSPLLGLIVAIEMMLSKK